MWQTIILILLLAGLSPDAALAANSAGNFGGVGIDGVPLSDGRIQVRQLVTGGPAHLSGIRAGDIITHIDGKQTKGSDFRRMVDTRLRGRAGTKVLLTIRRPGEEKPLHVTLVRRQLITPPLSPEPRKSRD
jgi:C-terminal processing protease CtpA/Prc